MPILKDIMQNMKNNFQKSWFHFLFKWTALGELLSQEGTPRPYDFFYTYFSSWWWTRWWFKSCISDDKQQDFEHITNFLRTVSLRKLLYDKDIQLFNMLYQSKILTPDNFEKIIWDDELDVVQLLHQAGILTQKNFDWGTSGVYQARNRSGALVSLQHAGMLTQTNMNLLRRHVRRHANPRLECSIIHLHHYEILTPENLNSVLASKNPDCLASALVILHQAEILTPENRNSILASLEPANFFASALVALHKAQLLTRENRNLLRVQQKSRILAMVLEYLNQANILTQTNLEALLTPVHAALLSDRAMNAVWYRMTRRHLTPANFQRLLTASEHDNPLQELERVTNDIIGIVPRALGAPMRDFNGEQSTHTASVHRSVSESAIRLRDAYETKLNLSEAIEELQKAVEGLDDSLEHAAAKRCIVRLTQDYHSFTDEKSQVTIKQLLALAWYGINDETRCTATYEEAFKLLVRGLYEIQRDGNLNPQNQDNGHSEDGFICPAGTFNKIMEKLNGIHPLVEVYYITHEGAYLKISKLADKHALAYLNSLAHPKTEAEYQRISEILEAIQKDGSLGPIWDAIKEGVSEELWDEFQEAYSKNKEHRLFKALMENGRDLNAPDVSGLQAQIRSNYAKAQEANSVARLGEHSLWESQDAPPQSPQTLDSKMR
jgi:hypothetical protein